MKHTVVALLIAILIFSCGDTIKTKEGPHVFHYYPKNNVYYDSIANHFVLFDSIKNEWIDKKDFTLNLDSGKYARLILPADSAWMKNAEHRIIYSAALYMNPEDLVEKEVETVTPSPVTMQEEKEEEDWVDL